MFNNPCPKLPSGSYQGIPGCLISNFREFVLQIQETGALGDGGIEVSILLQNKEK